MSRTSSSRTRRGLGRLFGGFGFTLGEQPWEPHKDLPGDPDSDQLLMFCGGLSSRSTWNLLPHAREMRDAWPGRKPHIRIANLHRHTGSYRDFVASRFWYWLFGMRSELLQAARDQKLQRVVLVGYSTGALVALLLLLWSRLLPCCFKGVRIERLVLLAPAFRLRSRVNSMLLHSAGILYYLGGPASFGTIAVLTPSLRWWCLLGLLLHYLVVPHLTIPNGEQRYLREKAGQWFGLNCFRLLRLGARETVVVSLTAFAYTAMPVLLSSVSVFAPDWLLRLYLSYLGLLLLPPALMLAGLAGNGREPGNSSGYQWLPVVTAVSLVQLQIVVWLLGRTAAAPVLLVIAERDVVVDNHLNRSLCQRNGWSLLELRNCRHADWPAEEVKRVGKVAAVFATEPLEQNQAGIVVSEG